MHRLMFSTGTLALAFSVVLAGSASISSAASYGNFASPTGTVSFNNVADLNGLFGAPTVSGQEIALEGLTIPVLSRSDLLKNKKAVGRPKDIADVAWLEGRSE